MWKWWYETQRVWMGVYLDKWWIVYICIGRIWIVQRYVPESVMIVLLIFQEKFIVFESRRVFISLTTYHNYRHTVDRVRQVMHYVEVF